MGPAAREQLIEGDAMDGLAQSVNTAGLFSTGSGRPLAVSQRAVRRASALVGEEVDEATDNNNKKRSKSFCT
jgi:breast cancer 2 susceptibility protein